MNFPPIDFLREIRSLGRIFDATEQPSVDVHGWISSSHGRRKVPRNSGGAGCKLGKGSCLLETAEEKQRKSSTSKGLYIRGSRRRIVCALVRVRLFPLLSHVYTWRRLLYIRGERTSGEVKINEERRGGGRGTRNRTRRGGRGMNGGESRIVVQTFHHPYEGSR